MKALRALVAQTLEGVRVVSHPGNLGLGSVYRTGLFEAGQDLVTFFPADRQFEATIIRQFLDAIGIQLESLPESP